MADTFANANQGDGARPAEPTSPPAPLVPPLLWPEAVLLLPVGWLALPADWNLSTAPDGLRLLGYKLVTWRERVVDRERRLSLVTPSLWIDVATWTAEAGWSVQRQEGVYKDLPVYDLVQGG